MDDPLYRVRVKVTKAARPYEQAGLTPGDAWQFIDSALGAWGEPMPSDIRTPDALSALLAELTCYFRSGGAVAVTVTRQPVKAMGRPSAA